MNLDRPNYQVISYDLSTARENVEIRVRGSFFKMVRAVDASGALALDALVRVKLGTIVEDEIPLSLNGAIIGRTDRYTLGWGAQPGVTVHFLLSLLEDGQGIEVDAPPAKQLVTQAKGAGFTFGAVTVGTSAVMIAAANGLRQSLTIKNTGTATVYLGDASVTTGTGLPLDPGEAFTLDGSTGAVYAIAGSAGQAVRWLEEA